METDCLEIVDLWKSRQYSMSMVAPVLLEIRELASSFSFFDIQHVNRSANVPTHLCAKHACTLTVTESWTGLRPSFLLTSLLADDARSLFVE
uniref:RNase H type-1 domain-containing protein n=1 Tax=Aegilops tauschii subsp. strangulata TaxID=200361 RepID=A0A453FJQ7_AEGTS